MIAVSPLPHRRTSGARQNVPRRITTKFLTVSLQGTDESRGTNGSGTVSDDVEEATALFHASSDELRNEHDVRMDQHRLALDAQIGAQSIRVLEGMIPLEAHVAIVESYEMASADFLAQMAASYEAGFHKIAEDFCKRHQALRAHFDQREASFAQAKTDLADMSRSLSRLKSDVGSLRSAMKSHAGHVEEAQMALALEIRKSEVEPARKRAEQAEYALVEFRKTAQKWLASARETRSEAIVDARRRGREDVEVEIVELRRMLDSSRSEALQWKQEADRERLDLKEAVADAVQETFDILAESAFAAATAVEAARRQGLNEGVREGFTLGLGQGFVEGHRDGVEAGRTATASRPDNTEDEARAARKAEQDMRIPSAKHLTSAHEQKVRHVETERQGSDALTQRTLRPFSEDREALARMLQERIQTLERHRNAALAEGTEIPREEGRLQMEDVRIQEHGRQFVNSRATSMEHSSEGSFQYWQECGGSK